MNRTTTLQRTLLAMAMLLLSATAALAWEPSETYGLFIRTMHVDRAWEITTASQTDTDGDGNGAVDNGIHLVEFPGYIAWSCMIWNEHNHDTDDYQLDKITVTLHNSLTGESMVMAKVQFDTSDDNDTKFNYTVRQNGTDTYALTRRYYRDYIDGSVFAYFMTECTVIMESFIKRAGSHLQVKVYARWDNTHWTDYNETSDAHTEDFSFLPPNPPTVSNAVYTTENGVTGIRATVSNTDHLEDTKLFVGVNQRTPLAIEWNVSNNTYFLPISDLKKEHVDTDKLAVYCEGTRKYTYSTLHRNTTTCLRESENGPTIRSNQPGRSQYVTDMSPRFEPTHVQLPLDGSFQVTDLGTGTVRVKWQTSATQSGTDYDESRWILEFGKTADFSDAQTVNIDWSRTQTNYSQDFEIEREQGEQTFHARLHRASMAAGNPNLHAQCTMNTDYKKVTHLEVENLTNADGTPNGHIGISWQLSDGIWPSTTRLQITWGEGGIYQANRNETDYTVTGVPTCTPIDFTLKVTDQGVAYSTQTYTDFIVPETTPSLFSHCSVSKGYYNDHVDIRWTVDPDGANFKRFLIRRKELGEADENLITVYTDSYRPGEYEYSYIDRSGLPGIYYEYTLEGWTACDSDVYIASSLTEIGFAQPYGVVSGQIVYSGNQGVAGATVSAVGNDSRSNRSLHLLADSRVALPNGGSMMQAGQGTVEMFFMPDQTQTDYTLLTWPAGQISLTAADELLIPHRFNHLAWSWEGRAYNLYVNGQPALTGTLASAEGAADSIFITGISGYIDELRFWSTAHDSAAIAGTCSRYLAGNEDGLTGYYRCDDQVPSELFDISRSNTRFNEHHGLTWGATIDPDHTPESDQLSLKAITDDQGHYLINAIPYTADGSLYTVTPTLGEHEFAPTSKPLFFFESTSTHNNTDFTDQSSFSVRGAIYYEGTTVPVEGVKFKIDGTTYCTREGELITTDSKGEFEISVPIGRHFIVAEKDHHTFADGGRYPAGAGNTVVFEKPMENLRFTDLTTVLLVGRVAGGSKESAKPHGFGAGKANTGAAEIVLAMPNAQQSLNTAETQRDWLTPDTLNCRSKAYSTGNSTGSAHRIVIRTDSATGEFAVALPPVDLSVTRVSLLSDPDYTFSESCLRTIKLSDRPGVTLTDSLLADDGTKRKCNYALAYDAIRSVEPSFIINQGYDAGLGDRSILVKKADADTTIALYEQQADGTIDYRMGYPVFHQQTYTWKMQVADIFANLDGTRPVYDTIPWEKGKLTIYNELDARGGGTADLDEDGRFTYTWDGGNPQLVAPYRMGMQLSVTDSLGKNPAPWQGNTTWQAYMLGGKLEDGNDFVTMGPDKILYILRCPPGASSTATWKSGSTMHYVDNTWNHWNGHEELVTKTLAGAKAKTAVGGIAFYIISEIKATNTFTAGFQSDQTKTWNYINTTTTSIQTDLTTDRSSGLSGSNGDVYYGYSTNLLFGTCQKLNLEYDAEADDFSFSVKKAISMGDSVTTTFQYSQYDIINNKIPNLKLLRKQCDMFQVSAADYDSATYANYSNHYIYITLLPTSDPLCYEPGNYLPVRPKFPNVSTSDSLTMYNCAIKGWENAIRKNEEAKVLAIRGGSATYDENAMKLAARKLNLFGWLRSLFNGNTLTKHWVAADDIDDNSDILSGHYHLETEQDLEGRNYPTYYIYRTDFEAWKQENGIAGINEDEVRKHHFYRGGYLLSNESVSGGAAPSKTFTTSHTQGSTTTFDYTCSGIIGDEFGLSINYTGVDVSIKTTQGGGHGSTDGSDSTLVSTIAYSLTSATTETYTVDVFQAPDNYGPIFYVRGGESYCPYEKPETTLYYEPGTPISQGTIQMQQPQITSNGQHHYTIADVPAGTAATLPVQLSNLADLENRAANMEFQLAVAPDSNPHGLDVRLNGRTIGFDSENFFLHCPESIDQTLTIQQTDRSVNEYNDVAILMRSVCQWNVICDTLWISVRFIPECTPLQLSAPGTTVSSLTGDTLDLTVSGFDRNYYGLADISLQRRHPTDTQWTTDTVVNASLIQSGTLHLRMPFTSGTWPDGLYEVRAVSHCAGNVDNSSNILEITKDMQRPTILGSPEPSNGYYTLDNDLAVNWSEPIQYATLSKARNFRITGSLNAAEVDHDVALSLFHESHTEASLLINSTSFGCEMWLRTRSDGDILAFNGNACKASVENGKLKVETGNREGGNVLTSALSLPADTWVYLYICIEQEATSSVTAKAFYDDQTLTFFDHQPIPALSTNGNITVGGGMQGEMHDLKLWARARTVAEAQSQMHTTPDLYSAGLTAYWPLCEGIGTTAEERMRSRNLILPENAWYLAGVNYAAAVAESADIDITAANIAASDEYVLEFWLRTDDARSLLAVADGSDTLRIGQQGQTLTLASPYTQRTYTAPYASQLGGGIWHHYALSYIRNGYATFYIDGMAEMTVPQEAVNGLRGQSIHLAPGAYDEIRFWRGRVDASLISGRRYDRCTGTESGLAWRFAFEKDETDSGNQHQTVFSADKSSGTEQVSISAVAQDISCPPLKAARAEEDVMFDFTSSADRTVFTLTSDANRIEGASLTCTASLIPDAAGNLSDPVSWQVKVNRSQLDWVSNTLSISTIQGYSSSAHVYIRNRSGIDDTWQITGLPSWLALGQTEGSISGMSISTIAVNTDESLAPGYYNATLTLTGRQGIKKTLDVSLHVQAQQPMWEADASIYDQTMSIIGQVMLPNGFANSADHQLGVFQGNQCVGMAHPQYFANYGTFFTMLTVYGNRMSSGSLTFRFWDSTSGRVFSPLTPEIDGAAAEITFQDGQVVGSLLSPVIFRCNADNIQQTVSAEEGWNWLSFYVQPASTAFAGILQPVFGQLVQIKDPYGFSVPDGDNLRGNLVDMAPEYMYKTRFKAPVSFQLEGSQYLPAQHPITIHPDWNWIGFMSTTNLSVKEALSMYSPVVGDVIKSRTNFSIWDGTDWVGTLRFLVPGSGYMYKSARTEETVLIYPSSGASRAPRRAAAAQAEHYRPDVNGRYPTTMSVVAQVRSGNDVVTGYELGAFIGSECRGATAPDSSLLFLSLEGEAGETVTFRLYNSATGEEILARETLGYAPDSLVGSVSEPFILQIGQADALIDAGSADGQHNIYKVIRDGRVFIIREGEWYDVLGRKKEE